MRIHGIRVCLVASHTDHSTAREAACQTCSDFSIGQGATPWVHRAHKFIHTESTRCGSLRPLVRGALHMLPDNAPLVTAPGDTSLRKTGRKIPGVGYRHDPMSPPFHVNLVPGQRFVQLSAMVPAGEAPSPARGVPVRFHHQPPVRKPKADRLSCPSACLWYPHPSPAAKDGGTKATSPPAAGKPRERGSSRNCGSALFCALLFDKLTRFVYTRSDAALGLSVPQPDA